IINPTRKTVWELACTQTVLWETNNTPEGEHNSTAVLLLGYMENMSQISDTEHPLAVNVPIINGQVSVTVPQDMTPRSNAIVVFAGYSGNASPEFTIT
ncbi:uncharacterized protein EDB91DRAFT_1066973, partial [Suillus paluster]|uniref:uncharacterized protein n=1 Tax=Suillus paluster TaxID=48578 RepID=UPI001B86B2BC